MSRLLAITDPRGATLRWTLGLFLVQATLGPLLHVFVHRHDGAHDLSHGPVAEVLHGHAGASCGGHEPHAGETGGEPSTTTPTGGEIDAPCPDDCDDPSHHHTSAERHPHAHSCSICSLAGSLAPAPRALTPSEAERASLAAWESVARPERAAARPGSPRAPPSLS